MSRRRFLAALATIVAINAAWVVYDRAVVRSLARSCQLRQDTDRGLRALEGAAENARAHAAAMEDVLAEGRYMAEHAQ